MIQVDFESSVSALSPAVWNACAGTDNPFTTHEFLSALEDSGCVGNSSGWLPRPLVARSAQGEVIGILPCYLKLHSKGEYIFDYHWAEAYHRIVPQSGYYPKLQVAVPFTPVPGNRILLRPYAPDSTAVELLARLRIEVDSLELSSAHITFCSALESQSAQSQDYLLRTGEQYHWYNEGYSTFDDFLADLTSRKRKSIRKERRAAQAHPLRIQTLHGREMTAAGLDAFFRMYHHTCMQKWGSPYLNREFFELLVQRMPDRSVFVLATRNGETKPVAGAWNLRGDTVLFGRNWGALAHFDLLHFEVCYYRAIDYAIEHGLQRVEAGAQGTHKIQRGYRPRYVYSVHYIRDAAFRRAIENYLEQERAEIAFRLEALSDLEPFRANGSLNEGRDEQS